MGPYYPRGDYMDKARSVANGVAVLIMLLGLLAFAGAIVRH
jgi:hypothetical protein